MHIISRRLISIFKTVEYKLMESMHAWGKEMGKKLIMKAAISDPKGGAEHTYTSWIVSNSKD